MLQAKLVKRHATKNKQFEQQKPELNHTKWWIPGEHVSPKETIGFDTAKIAQKAI